MVQQEMCSVEITHLSLPKYASECGCSKEGANALSKQLFLTKKIISVRYESIEESVVCKQEKKQARNIFSGSQC